MSPYDQEVKTGRDTDAGIWVMDPDGSNQTRLTSSSSSPGINNWSSPSWGTRGKVSPVPTPIPTPTPAPLVFGVSPLIEQGQTNIELISEQEQLLEVPTDQFTMVSATFKQPLTSNVVLDFGVRLGMPWSGTEIEIKIRNSYAGNAELIVTRRHVQLGIIYWEQIDQLVGGGDIFKIEFQEESGELAFVVNGVSYPIEYPPIGFDLETFENITLFVNSENKVINAQEPGFASTPYVSVTNFYVRNNGNVLIP